MKILNFTLIKLLVFLIVGIVTGHLYKFSIWIIVTIILLVLFFLFVLIFIKKVRRHFFTGFLFLVLSFLTGVLTDTLHELEESPDKNKDKHKTILKFTVNEILKPSKNYNKYIVLSKINNNSTSQEKILLYVKKDSIEAQLRIDEKFVANALVTEIPGPKNPLDFSYKRYLSLRNIRHQLYCTISDLHSLGIDRHSLKGWAYRLRQKINHKLNKYHLPPEEKAVINALLLGQRNELSPELYNDYKRAGAVHILAISGLHIGVLLIFLNSLFYPLLYFKHGRKLRLFLVVLFLWGFAIITGLSPSVIRAVTMFTFLAYAFYLNRPTNTYNILALSMFFLLLINPHYLYEVGFQLSYAAVFSIVAIQPLFLKWWRPNNWFFKRIWQLFSVSIAAQLGVFPITLFYFHQFPGLFFVSNLIIIPFLGIILGLGILVIILSLLNFFPETPVTLLSSLLNSMNRLVQWVSKQEQFVFTDIYFDKTLLVLSIITVILVINLLYKPNQRRLIWGLLCIIAFQLNTFYNKYSIQKEKTFIVFHQNRDQLLAYQKGSHLTVFKDSLLVETSYSIRNFIHQKNISDISYKKPEVLHIIKDGILLIVDSLGIYDLKNFSPNYVVLSYSPKIHLKRLIDSLQPSLIIADGSNYPSMVELWRETCKKERVPFHYTGEKGAYIICE